MQEGIGESFSFEESRRHKQMIVRNTALEELKKLEEQILAKNQVRIEEFDDHGQSTTQLTECATEEF